MSIFPRSISISGALALILGLSACPATTDDPVSADGSSGETGSDESTSDPGNTSGAPTTTGSDESTEGPPADGECIGLIATSTISRVLARDGAAIDPNCSREVAPCGGDPVGTWAIVGDCGIQELPNPYEDMCPGSEFYAEYTTVVGTYTFDAEGGYTLEYNQELLAHTVLDTMACLGVSCADFEAQGQEIIPDYSCTEEGTDCHCTFAEGPADVVLTGTYEVMGDELAIEDGGAVQTWPFCVDGDRLEVWQAVYEGEATGLLCTETADCEVLEGYDIVFCTSDLPDDSGG